MAAQQTFAFFQSDDAVTTRATDKKTASTAKKRHRVSKTATPPTTKDTHPTTAPQLAPAPIVADTCEAVLESRETVLERLRVQAGCVSLAPADDRPTLSTGCFALDHLLPTGGLKIDALTEWIGETDSSGASTMSLIAAANQLKTNSLPLVVIDHDQQFYPPAAVALGIPAERMIVVRPESRSDLVWSIDQALRCDSVAAVWAPVGSWLKDHDARRFQLAAEIGNTPGLLVRPTGVRGRPSFAEVRFHVNTQKNRSPIRQAANRHRRRTGERQSTHKQLYDLPFFAAEITIDRCRGDAVGKRLWVQIDDQARLRHIAQHNFANQPLESYASHETATHRKTAAVHLADQLAHPTPKQKTSRRRA